MRALTLMTLVFSCTSAFAQPEIEPVADCATVYLGYWNGAYYYETVSCVDQSVQGYGTSGALCENYGCNGQDCQCQVTPGAFGAASGSGDGEAPAAVAVTPQYPDNMWVHKFLMRVKGLYDRREDEKLNPLRKQAAITLNDAESDPRKALAAFLAAEPSEKLNKWRDYREIAGTFHTFIDAEPVNVARGRRLLLSDGLYPFGVENGYPSIQTNRYQARNMPSLRPNPQTPVQAGRPSVILKVENFNGEEPAYFQIRYVRRRHRLYIGQQVRIPDAQDLQLDDLKTARLIYKGRHAHTIEYQRKQYVVTTVPAVEDAGGAKPDGGQEQKSGEEGAIAK